MVHVGLGCGGGRDGVAVAGVFDECDGHGGKDAVAALLQLVLSFVDGGLPCLGGQVVLLEHLTVFEVGCYGFGGNALWEGR